MGVSRDLCMIQLACRYCRPSKSCHMSDLTVYVSSTGPMPRSLWNLSISYRSCSA